ncbi:MAG: hypothetical protein ABI910_10630 [Gemmatimonadota bacterium]
MTRRLTIGATIVATCCIALAYASAFVPGGARWGAWCMVVGLATMVVSLMTLGVVRRDRGVGRLAWPLAFTFVVIVAGFGAALVLPVEGPGARLLLGLPLRAAIVLYGVGLLPILVLPIAYAATFDSMTLSEDDLARVRALGVAHRERQDAARARGES